MGLHAGNKLTSFPPKRNPPKTPKTMKIQVIELDIYIILKGCYLPKAAKTSGKRKQTPAQGGDIMRKSGRVV